MTSELQLTHLRHALRECLMARRADTAAALLSQLGHAAGSDRALHREYQRWCLQFDLLTACEPA